jgi:ankyrin repeat protein
MGFFRFFIIVGIAFNSGALLSMATSYDMLQALIKGDLSLVQFLDPDGNNEPLLGVVGYVRWTPLYYAACNGHFNIVYYYVEKLKAKGKPINPVTCTTQNETPLHSATRKGYLAIVRYLTGELDKQGEDPNPEVDGLTPFRIALEKKKGDLVRIFTRFGCSEMELEESRRLYQ